MPYEIAGYANDPEKLCGPSGPSTRMCWTTGLPGQKRRAVPRYNARWSTGTSGSLKRVPLSAIRITLK